MVSSATDREAGELSRARKRERDKENQRQKRQREKEAFQELQRRNESLERQVKELRNASSGNDQQLVESVQLLRAKNQALEARLGEVDAFIQRWVSPNKLDDTNSVSASRNGGLRGGDGMHSFAISGCSFLTLDRRARLKSQACLWSKP